MKRLLFLLLILISICGYSQGDKPKYSGINGYGFIYKRMGLDSVLLVPLSSSPHVPYRMGAIRYSVTDSLLDVFTGYQWISGIRGIQLSDSSFKIGRDTIVIRGTGGGVPSGSAGGDLTGTYPNPTIGNNAITTSKISNGAVSIPKLNVTGTADNTTFLRGDGTWAAAGGTPGGSNTQIQYNGVGAFAGDAGLTYNAAQNKLTTDSIRSIKNTPDTVHIGSFETDATDSAWFFGTSITAGSSATSNAGRYTKIVADQLRVVEMNFGHGGYLLQKTPTWPLTNTFMDVYTTDIPVKLPNRKYLFFAWGENDATNDYSYHTLFGVDTSEFKTDYKTVIDYAISRGWAKSEMRIISPFYQLTSSCPLNIQQNYYNAAKYFADSAGIAFIDVFTQGANYNSLILTDYIHPSNFGHALHADAILKQMSQQLQIKPGENVVNQGTTVLNKVYHFGNDTATTGFQLAGINTNGTLVKVPSEKYLLLDNTNVPVQSGNASVLGNLNAGKQLRVAGVNGYTTGKGLEFSYDGSKNGHMYAFDRDAVTSGNILIDFGRLIVGASPTAPFTNFYVNGSGSAKGLYSAGGANVLYNSNDNTPTLNMLVSSDSIGYITTYAVSGYRPTALNPGSTQPVLINTFSLGSSGAKLIVNGSIAADADSVTTATGGFLFRDAVTKKWKMTAAPSGVTGSGTSGRVAYWDGASSLNSNANFLFGTPNGPSLSVGTNNTQGVLTLGGNKDLSSSGIQQYWTPATYTDQITAASGTANSYSINYIGSPTVAAANTGVTFPEITTLTIEKPLAGTNATLSKRTALRVNGLLNTTEAVQRSYSGAATNITLDNTYDIVAVSASGGNVTITLPAASGTNAGLTYTIKRTDASGNTCTVAGTIDGATNYSLTAQYKYVTVTSNGTDWYIIANN